MYVPINENVSFVAKFTDYSDAVHPFMYHCHFLDHEDAGMMGQFVVTGSTSVPVLGANAVFTLYPNPATDLVRMNVAAPTDKALQLTLTDLSGRVVYNQMLQPYTGQNTFELMVNDLPRGAYLAVFSNEDVRQTVRLMLQ